MVVHSSQYRTIANADGAAILDTEEGRITTLNATGAFVWEKLQEGNPEEGIASELSRLTGEPVEETRADVAAFVHALQEQGLLS